jgi:type I restriction enzyme S subunit
MSKLGDDAAHDSHKYKEIRLGPNQISIPQNWSFDKIGKYIHIVTGSPFSSDYFNDRGDGIPLIRIRNLQNGQTSTFYNGDYDKKFLTDNGSILVGMDGNFHTVRWGGRQGLLNQRVARIEVNDKRINESYLFYRLINEIKKIETRTPATTVKHLSKKKIEDIRTPLPPPPEQRRIAEILSTVDELIQQTDAIIEAKQHLTQGFINVLVKTGVQDSPDTNKVQIGPKQVKIPTNWDLLRVDELVTDDDDAIRTGPFGSKLKKEYFVSEGVKVYEQSNVYYKDFTHGNRYVTQDRYESELTSYDANPGDVLITLQGTIGDAAVLPDNAEPGVINQKLMRVQVDSELCLPEYFATFFDESRLADFQIEAVSHGAVVSGLNISTISGIRVPIPSLQEQQRIVDVVESSKSSLDEEQETKQNLQELKRGLMQDLLTGEVRVPVET